MYILKYVYIYIYISQSICLPLYICKSYLDRTRICFLAIKAVPLAVLSVSKACWALVRASRAQRIFPLWPMESGDSSGVPCRFFAAGRCTRGTHPSQCWTRYRYTIDRIEETVEVNQRSRPTQDPGSGKVITGTTSTGGRRQSETGSQGTQGSEYQGKNAAQRR